MNDLRVHAFALREFRNQFVVAEQEIEYPGQEERVSNPLAQILWTKSGKR